MTTHEFTLHIELAATVLGGVVIYLACRIMAWNADRKRINRRIDDSLGSQRPYVGKPAQALLDFVAANRAALHRQPTIKQHRNELPRAA